MGKWVNEGGIKIEKPCGSRTRLKTMVTQASDRFYHKTMFTLAIPPSCWNYRPFSNRKRCIALATSSQAPLSQPQVQDYQNLRVT